MKLFRYVVLLVFLLGNLTVHAQKITKFTDDPVVYIEELKKFFNNNTNDPRHVKKFLEKFEELWISGSFNESHKQATYEISNLMLKKRIRPATGFEDYLESMMQLVNSNQSAENFNAWLQSIHKILDGKAIRYFKDYLKMSKGLFESNIFFDSPTATWYSNNDNFKFVFDKVPKVEFPSLDLSCANVKGDSIAIYETKGVYYPTQGKFVGEGGLVTWERAGLEPQKVYANLQRYVVTVKTGRYKADSVQFYNLEYFNQPLLGVLNEKVKSYAPKQSVNYPQFDSYNKRLQIPNLMQVADFDGGFTMRGEKFIGSGSEEEDAYLIFKREGKRFLEIAAREFSFTKERFNSQNAEVTFRIGEDSIYHPGIVFKFFVPERRMSLIREEQGISKTPYFNSYHTLDMYFEELTWLLDEPQLKLGMLKGNAQGEADFESSNYYKEFRWYKLQQGAPTNPLVLIKDFVKANDGEREFYGKDLASFIRLTHRQTQPLLIRLSFSGFIIYDVEEDKVIVKDKLFDYIKNRAGQKDYDVLNFHSRIPGQANATINLLTNEMTIKGLKNILLSDSQKVYIYPNGGEVTVNKNRDFSFEGVVNAGRFEFFGKEFSFGYEDFKINLDNVDSLRMRVKAYEKGPDGRYPIVRVKTVIENINGELLIDHPQNKSGVKSLDRYPVFNSLKDSYVFYEKRSIQKGVYNRDKFYFHLEPFTIDSLDNFTKEGLRLKGDFVSAGIFPQFEEHLTVQPDYSLGFKRNAPPEGFALYGGKGKFENEIRMSHEGLRGDGDIHYVTSTTKSDDFIFFPDSMNSDAQVFDVREKKGGDIEFPQVHGEKIYVHWEPYADQMHVEQKGDPFNSYNGQADFVGYYDLTPELLSGGGIAEFSDAELESDLIRFKHNEFFADTSDFRLKSLEMSELAFSTSNVNAHINFNERVGNFKSNGKGSVVKFPVNQYICFMENFKWYMDEDNIAMVGDGKEQEKIGEDITRDLELEGPEFISVHPKQDSLRFFAPEAKYDLKKYIIRALDVQYINVADARIFPDSGNVVIEKKAVMQPLVNSKILANSVTKHHQIYEANVNVFGRKSYSGSGYYDYVDELKNEQKIYFESISVDTTFQTYGETEIPEDQEFTLSPNFDYKGKVFLAATNPALLFKGTAMISHQCEEISRNWFYFESEVDPDDIYIPISKKLEDEKGKPLATSMMMTKDSTNRVYSAFLSPVLKKSDVEILHADSFLYFDKKSREYRISNKEKLVERNQSGNYLSINTNTCKVEGEGMMDLPFDFGQIKMESYGTAEHFLVADSVAIDVMMSIDFFFDDNMLSNMSEAINGYAGLTPLNFGYPLYAKGLRELLGKEKADKLLSQVNLYGSFKKFPDELKKTIFITGMKMKWNKERRSFVSIGAIGIGNMGKTQINKYVNGRVEYRKARGGDELNIYLELDGANWYYFNYARGFMQTVSTDEAYNAILKELKDDKKELKTARGETPYRFNLSTERKKRDFIRKTE